MSRYVVVGAGATGRAVTKLLTEQGNEVSVVSRSGAAHLPTGAQAVTGDASSAEFLSKTAHGAVAIFNCANPAYHRWLSDWPPIATALLHAAASSGSALVTLSNLYAYGPPSGPMTPHDPLVSNLPKAQVRARMWHEAKEWHDAGRIQATEVRASDFIGAGSQSLFERAIPAMRQGKTVTMISPLDTPHSWSYITDVARTLVTAAQNPLAMGRPWHAATNDARTIRGVLADLASAGGISEPRVRVIPQSVLAVMGLFSPLMRELPKVAYQFSAPFVIDDSETRSVLGVMPTAWSDVISETWRAAR